MMTFDEMHNGLRILNSIDAHELGDPEWYPEFASDPFRFLIRCNGSQERAIWSAMVKRGAIKEPV